MTLENSFGSKTPAMMEDENRSLRQASYEVRSTGHMRRETIDRQTAGPDLCRRGAGKDKAMVPRAGLQQLRNQP